MKNIAFKIGIFYVSLLMLIAFLPTKNLYFLAGEKLQQNNLFINEKSIGTFLVNTYISDVDLYFEDIKALVFESLSFKFWFIYNSINIDNITIDQALKDFLPLHADNLSVVYTIFYPHKLILSAEGDFGSMSGYVNLIDRVLMVELDASDIMKTSFKKLLGFMKTVKTPDQKNRYIYEYSF